jgi:predicted Na+-dependent transporter
MNKMNAWLNRRLFLLILSALIAGCFFPVTQTSSMKSLVVILFCYMTFATSLATSFSGFLRTSRNPKIALSILALVHIVTPVMAWIAGLLVFPDQPLLRIGYLISAALPVGITSVLWTALVRGNVPVSLLTVTIDVIIAPALLPLFILVTAGVVVRIDYTSMIIDLLLMITIPSIIGMLLYDASGGKTARFVEGPGGILARIALLIIVFLNSAYIAASIVWSPLLFKVIAASCVLVAAGYFIGYLAGRAIRTDHATTLSIIYNTGMRNTVVGLVIATSYFPLETTIPLAMTMLFQQPYAALTEKFYRWMHPDYYRTDVNELPRGAACTAEEA